MFVACLKKELREDVRRYRFLVLVGLLLIFAILSPAIAKMMPKILAGMKSNPSAGITITFSREPNVLDGFFQYLKNLNLYPLLIMLIFMGLIPDEMTKGTAEMVLTKPVSRSSFVLSKFLASALVVLVSIVIATAVCLFYSYVLFGKFSPGSFVLVNLYLFIYLLVFVAFVLFLGAFSRSTGAVALGGIAFYVILLVCDSFPRLRPFNPQGLYDATWHVLIGEPVPYLAYSLTSTLVLTATFVVSACLILERKEI
jgi:ABC-2 type transport system permease protein